MLSLSRMELPQWFDITLTERAALVTDKNEIKELFKTHKDQLKTMRRESNFNF